MKHERAEVVGLQALGWLMGQDDLGQTFLGTTGASAEDLRSQAGDPAFLASVLDFLMMDDAWVTAFCDAVGLEYEQPMIARNVLIGPAGMHWT